MSEFLPEVAVDMWAEAIKEVKARRESMAWAVDKLRKLKRNCEYCAASCEEIAQALDEETNPRLKEIGAVALKEYANKFATWSGMSTAQVEPHPEPPKEKKIWE